MSSREGKVQTEAVENAAPEAASRTFAVGRDEGEARWWMGGLATIKATGKETDGRYTLIEIFEPEGEGPLHVHHREDEGFFIIEGELTFQVGEETIKASPGSFVFGPKDVPHTYTVDSGTARDSEAPVHTLASGL
jgi:mannose-6-phosphate isomerase-like protein (cupin superfamily)